MERPFRPSFRAFTIETTPGHDHKTCGGVFIGKVFRIDITLFLLIVGIPQKLFQMLCSDGYLHIFYFLNCAKFQKDWTTFILGILQGFPFEFLIDYKNKGWTLIECLVSCQVCLIFLNFRTAKEN